MTNNIPGSDLEPAYPRELNVDTMRTCLHLLKTSFDTKRESIRRTDEVISSSFNVFDYIVDRRSEKGELMLSNVLAMILRADGDHGQGEAFQKLFFKAVKDRCDVATTDEGAGLSSCPDSGYQVLIEENIDGLSNVNDELQKGRMDISLHHPDKWIIGIENKPFASDQPKQIERYLDDMAHRADTGHGLVYLSGTGRSPQDHSISRDKLACANANGKFCLFSYKSDLVPFLHQCSQKCKSPRFSNFLDDFAGYVLHRF